MELCKKRAIDEINYSNDPSQGLISMLSDLGKHPETANHDGIMLTTILMMSGKLKTREEVMKHLEGFN